MHRSIYRRCSITSTWSNRNGPENSLKRSLNHIVSRAGIQESGYECIGRLTKASMLAATIAHRKSRSSMVTA
jgi:hypothetical protein